jgi:hypothetical protein
MLTAQAPGTEVLIYVVDTNDVERLEEAGRELQAVLKYDELQRAILLVYANKQVCSIPPTQLYVSRTHHSSAHTQDLPSAQSLSTVADRLGLTKMRR